MPEIRDDEISLAVCDIVGWRVYANCGGCRAGTLLDLARLRRHVQYRRALVHLVRDLRPYFRCRRCGQLAASISVHRGGIDGAVFTLAANQGPPNRPIHPALATDPDAARR